MTSIAAQSDFVTARLTQPAGAVARQVALLARRQQRIDAVAKLLRIGVVVALALLAIIVLDAVTPLSPWLRLAATCACVSLIAAALRRVYSRPIAERAICLREAVRIEEQAEISGNRVVNAVWLGGAVTAAGDTLTAALSQRCVDEGSAFLGRVDARQLIDRRVLRRQIKSAIAAILLWVVLAIVLPRLLTGGLLRMLLPWGDHPPFSLTKFNVTVTPGGPIEFGRDAEIEVWLSGRLPQRVEVVEFDIHGAEVRRFPMREAGLADAGGKPMSRRMQGLTASVTFRIEAETGHTRKQRIDVVAPPAAQPKEPAPTVADGSSQSTDPVRTTGAYTAALAEAAQRIRDKAAELAARLEALPAGEPVPPWLREQMEQLRQDIERFTGRAQSLEQLLQQLRDSKQHASAEALELQRVSAELAKKLAGLKLPEVSLGLRGTPIRSPKQAGEQARGAEKAAGDDLKNLQAGLAELEKLAGSTALGGSQAPVVLQSPDPRGVHETESKAGTITSVSEAVLRLAPEQYRELVASYFERLAKDAKGLEKKP